eukprot:825477-Ditylum_brightwellii.AAC.1
MVSSNSNYSQTTGRPGPVVMELNRYTVLKCEFYAAVAEEMMTYTDGVNVDNNACHNNDPLYGHYPTPIPQDYFIKRPQCVICSMEKSVTCKIQKIKNKYGRGFARCKTHLMKCSMPHCPITEHTCAPTESQTTCLP